MESGRAVKCWQMTRNRSKANIPIRGIAGKGISGFEQETDAALNALHLFPNVYGDF